MELAGMIVREDREGKLATDFVTDVADEERKAKWGLTGGEILPPQLTCVTISAGLRRLLERVSPMPTTTVYHTLDTQAQLELMRLQLQWLEREMAMLQRTLQASTPAAVLPPTRTFKSLRGAWAGVVVSGNDFRAARLTLPDNLL